MFTKTTLVELEMKKYYNMQQIYSTTVINISQTIVVAQVSEGKVKAIRMKKILVRDNLKKYVEFFIIHYSLFFY